MSNLERGSARREGPSWTEGSGFRGEGRWRGRRVVRKEGKDQGERDTVDCARVQRACGWLCVWAPWAPVQSRNNTGLRVVQWYGFYCTCVAISRLSQSSVGRENTVQVPRTFSHLTMFRQNENESKWLKSDDLLSLTCDHPAWQSHAWCLFPVRVCVCAVELPSDDDSVEAGSSARMWKHGGAEAGRADAAHLPLRRCSCQGGKWWRCRRQPTGESLPDGWSGQSIVEAPALAKYTVFATNLPDTLFW